MTDPPRRDGWGQEHPGAFNYPAPDGQQPPYQPPPGGPRPTEPFPAYSPYAGDPYTGGQYGSRYATGPVPPEPPKPGGPPRWLWILAGVALLAVLGLVMSLVIVNSSKQDTVVAPPQTPIEPTEPAPTTTTRTPSTTRSSTPMPTTAVPSAPATTTAPDQTDPSALHTVVYSVAGEGRAISILYLDSGRVLQTEFNVLLPWTREVQLTGPANVSASVSIVNVGHRITCSITVDGTETQQNSGTGLTLCTALGTR